MKPSPPRQPHGPRAAPMLALAAVAALVAACADGPRLPFMADVPESAYPAAPSEARPRLVAPHERQQRASPERQAELERELGELRESRIEDVRREIEARDGDS